MNKGSTYLMRNPYAGPHRIGGLGDDAPVIDYGVDSRASALARSQADRANRAYDMQDAQQKAFERQQVLDVTQKAAKDAAKASQNILVSGSNQLRRLLSVGGGVAVVALGALVVVALKKMSRGGRSGGTKRKPSVVRYSP